MSEEDDTLGLRKRGKATKIKKNKSDLIDDSSYDDEDESHDYVPSKAHQHNGNRPSQIKLQNNFTDQDESLVFEKNKRMSRKSRKTDRQSYQQVVKRKPKHELI